MFGIWKQKNYLFKVYVTRAWSDEPKKESKKSKIVEFCVVRYCMNGNNLKNKSWGSQYGRTIIDQAKTFYTEMKIMEPCAFFDGRLRNFKLQHGIRQLDVSGESESANADAAECYGSHTRAWGDTILNLQY